MGRFFFVLVMIVSVAVIPMVRDAGAGLAQPITNVYVPEFKGTLFDGSTGMAFDVTPEGYGTVYAIFIGTKSTGGYLGTPENPGDNYGGWNSMQLYVHQYGSGPPEYGAYTDTTYDTSVRILKGLGGTSGIDWSLYDMGYLFWAPSGSPGLLAETTGTFYVTGGKPASPWAEFHTGYLDPSQAYLVTPVSGRGMNMQGYTESGGTLIAGVKYPAAVPLPSALLLLGPGLVGLAAVRRKIKK